MSRNKINLASAYRRKQPSEWEQYKQSKEKLGKNAFSCFTWLSILILLWMAISSCIFAFRHPWASDTERLLHAKDAFLLRKIPYEEFRPK